MKTFPLPQLPLNYNPKQDGQVLMGEQGAFHDQFLQAVKLRANACILASLTANCPLNISY